MSEHPVCGFLVLRKPDMNFDEKGRGGFLSPAPRINDKYYGGVDRMPWFDIDEANSLPEDLNELWKEVKEHNGVYQDFCLVSDIDKAKNLLAHSNRAKCRNELIAIYSKNIAKVKGVFTSQADLIWLGIDIDCSGYGSQISQGIFKIPQAFPEFLELLNPNGLFEEEGLVVDRYIQAYLEREQEANLERMSDVRMLLDKIHLWRIQL